MIGVLEWWPVLLGFVGVVVAFVKVMGQVADHERRITSIESKAEKMLELLTAIDKAVVRIEERISLRGRRG